MTKYLRRKKPKKITIVYDDRENNPWLFLEKTYKMERKRLKVGDYTIKGYEKEIAIEKKSGLDELFSNLSAKTRPRFERFLKRLSNYSTKAIVVEQPFTHNSVGHAVWKLKRNSHSQMTAKTIHYWTSKIIIHYGIPIVFIDARSRDPIVLSIIEHAINNLGVVK
jgi:ERCC4-type nuclease